MRFKLLALVIPVMILYYGCKKADDMQAPVVPPPPPPVKITQHIILPEGSSIDLNTLTVNNGLFESPVTEGSYEVDTNSIHSTISFVTNVSRQPFLLKYNHPLTADQPIDAHSTALAIIMTAPLVTGLTEQGKTDLINTISATAEFAALENSILENLVAGKPLTDPGNNALRDAILAVFEKSSAQGTASELEEPLVIQRTGRQVSITNNGPANTYVAGVYRDGQQLNDLMEIPGTPRFAASTAEALNGIFLPFLNPAKQVINLNDDGKYEIRIRSGNPVTIDGSSENDHALKASIWNISWTIAESFLPYNPSCLKDLENNLKATYEWNTLPSFSGSLNEISTAIYNVAEEVISANINNAEACYKKGDVFGRYAEAVKNFLLYMKTVPPLAGTGMYVTPELYHLYYAKQSVDLCYTVTSDNITDCDGGGLYTYVYLGNFADPETSTGSSILFELHFEGNAVSGTATSGAFDYGSGVQTVPISGTLVGTSMTLSLHADNGILPVLFDCIEQPAPNCPSCNYTGDHVIQDWNITGTVNSDHSTYDATYTRNYTTTSIVTSTDCTTSALVQQTVENGVLVYSPG